MLPFDVKALRNALGRFTTGVTIATCRDGQGQAVGLTANSFNSLSLDPPLVLWSLRSASPALPAFQQASHFAINVLAEAQVHLSRRFAGAVPDRLASTVSDRFAEGQWADGAGGAPVLAGCAAVFECALYSQHTVGDHVLFIGRVEHLYEAALSPLVFQAGHYRLLGEIL
jgi:4-hydroxyphenylacetate 3-hydroxylase, reductase component